MIEDTNPERGCCPQSGAVSAAAGQLMIAVIAQELRNPLAAIRNAIGVMESASGQSEVTERAHRLSFLVDDLLAQLREILESQGGDLATGSRGADYASASVVRFPVLRTLRRRPSTSQGTPAPDIVQGGLAAWQRKRVRDYIKEHLGERLSVRDIAGVVRLSPSHFSRAFKRSFGVSAHVYLMHRRVEMAQHLMLSTAEALGSIAVTCGMSDQSHLTRWFRRVSGETPNSWRRARRAAPEYVGITRSGPAPAACEAAKTRM